MPKTTGEDKVVERKWSRSKYVVARPLYLKKKKKEPSETSVGVQRDTCKGRVEAAWIFYSRSYEVALIRV